MEQTSGTERRDRAEKATRRSLVLQLSIMVKSPPDEPGAPSQLVLKILRLVQAHHRRAAFRAEAWAAFLPVQHFDDE
jgi:hypothetical protein